MEVFALAIYAVWLFAAFGVRTVLHWRETGDSGWRGLSGRFGSPEWLAGVLFVVALVVGILGPMLVLLGQSVIARSDLVGIVGSGLALFGVGLTVAAQLSMRDSWRIGVDSSERTELRTTGLFGAVRNPIFSAMALTATGLMLMVPTVVSVGGLLALFVALQLQVRIVEEPYLLRTHGEVYEKYCSSAGRFVPRIGTK
jgi:protein-S-isoprenylcysteine O-methyltransferase Ste14